MASWEPQPVVFRKRTYAGVLFIAACCFVVGFLLLWGRL